jgi:hypothetical protein
MVKGAQAPVFLAFCDLADGDFFAYCGVPEVAHGEATAIFRGGSSKAQGKKLANPTRQQRELVPTAHVFSR